MLFSIVFCGYLLSKNRIPDGWSWAQDWSPANYAYEALVLNEFDGIDGLYVTSVVGENKVTAGPFTGEQILHCFGFIKDIPSMVRSLWIMAAVYLSAIFLLLKTIIRESR